ncbi:hypothetical protein DL89DRAFT_123564 [Linderina pennispora]|uniref:Uncharacterized protein n=1 Tax=Linderina pennispora TaxID=61395 RepID=A0A1Y1WDC6_9FUNG|nr:uncharacterized protein DL89DRAFT_123564 [Linderina pennispora]ORX71338.1 hypothetical protein DL89DRAFT_123564 [Linderina pennispora]
MSRAIYLFRNIRTKQVLASMDKTLLSHERLIAGQVPQQPLRPQKIRPDHWTPLAVLSGFQTDSALNTAFSLASMPGFPLRPPTAQEQHEYRLLKNKHKRLRDLDTTERQVAQLARSLIYMDHTSSHVVPKEGKLKLFWQDRQWIGKVEDAWAQVPRVDRA